MALMLSIGQSCYIRGSCKRMRRSMILFEAEGGCPNSFCRKMSIASCRFNKLFLRVSRSSSRSKHKLSERLLEEADHYDKARGLSDQSKLLSKVPSFVGFDGFNNLNENEKAEKQSGGNLKNDADNCDISLACKRFPSIILGSSPPVQLYDVKSPCSEMKSLLSDDSYKGFLPNDVAMALVNPEYLHDQWPSVDDLSNVNVSISGKLHDENQCTVRNSRQEDSCTVKELFEENAHSLTLYSENINLGAESNIDYKVSTRESSVDVQANSQSVAAFLDESISCIPGLTSRQHHRLQNCGFHTLRKLLHHFPRTYADVQNPQVGVEDGQYLISVGKILSSRGIRAGNSFSFLEVVVECKVADNELQHMIDDFEQRGKKTIYLHLKKFFSGARFASQPFLRSIELKYKLGQFVCVSGKVKNMPTKDHYEMREYNIDMLQDCEDSSICVEGRPHPIYPSKGGLNPDLLRDTIVRAVRALPANIDPIPKEISQAFELLSLNDAYIGIHMPKKPEDADSARRRLIFDEFFYLQLGRLFQMLECLGTPMEKDALLDKYRKPELNTVFMEGWSSLAKKFLKAIPYSLTPSQLSAVSEIIWDLKRSVPMSRLLQGDVGCGKTVVAFLACMEVISSGYQAALMVPTELLAIQHYEHLLNLLEAMEGDESKPRIALLTGSTPLKQSRIIRKDLQTGDLSMVIGTHSLIAEKVEFSALRIAVVDEQHRFGVIQRGRFNSKLYPSSLSSKANPDYLDGQSSKADVNMAPHILAMSATPIPRTLALALYGDVSLTQITDLPPGRIPVETHIIETNSDNFDKVYKVMQDELEGGGKIYVVYPIIEQSEQFPQLRAASADLEAISQRFLDYKCGLLHGRMKIDEKDEALRQFRCGETQILLATQVIEIGVDVPDASMMVVMNAERFGIAQLHQLRGRVGRGTKKSKCVLLASSAGSLNRLKVLEKSSDAFYLANMDLLLRGPGDLLGKKQSGHLPDFPIARLEVDGNILQDAHTAALKILGISHDLEKFPALKAELSMRQPLCILGD